MKTSLRCCLLLLLCTLCTSWHIPSLHRAASHALHQTQKACKTALLTTAITTALVIPIPLPSLAATTSLNDAIVEVSESSYPILKALKDDNFQAFSVKIADLLLTIQPDKLGKSIELAVDVLDSPPPEKFDQFNSVLKEAFTDLKIDSCTLVPLPPLSIVDRFQAIAVDRVPSAKLKTFEDTWKPSLSALSGSKTDAAICLPPAATLDKLSLAQADLGRSFGSAESKAFGSYTTPMLRQSITLSRVFPLINDAKKLAPTATVGEKAAFQAAGKKIELASKTEVAKGRVVAAEARNAETRAVFATRAAAQEEKRASDIALAKANSDPAVIQAKKEAAKKVAEEEKAAQAAKLEATIAANKAAKEAQAAKLEATIAANKAAKEALMK